MMENIDPVAETEVKVANEVGREILEEVVIAEPRVKIEKDAEEADLETGAYFFGQMKAIFLTKILGEDLDLLVIDVDPEIDQQGTEEVEGGLPRQKV